MPVTPANPNVLSTTGTLELNTGIEDGEQANVVLNYPAPRRASSLQRPELEVGLLGREVMLCDSHVEAQSYDGDRAAD